MKIFVRTQVTLTTFSRFICLVFQFCMSCSRADLQKIQLEETWDIPQFVLNGRLSDPSRAGIAAQNYTPQADFPWAQLSPHQGEQWGHHAGHDGTAMVPVSLSCCSCCLLSTVPSLPTSCPCFSRASSHLHTLKEFHTTNWHQGLYAGVKTKEAMKMCGLINTSSITN